MVDYVLDSNNAEPVYPPIPRSQRGKKDPSTHPPNKSQRRSRQERERSYQEREISRQDREIREMRSGVRIGMTVVLCLVCTSSYSICNGLSECKRATTMAELELEALELHPQKATKRHASQNKQSILLTQHFKCYVTCGQLLRRRRMPGGSMRKTPSSLRSS